jgi:hypothetical protein
MADAGGTNLDTGVLMEKRGCGRPHGSKNKPKDTTLVASSSASAKRRPGHPLGSKNKPKVSDAATPGSRAAPRNASPPPPPKIYSIFCIVGAQCREQQRVPLKFTKFMEGFFMLFDYHCGTSKFDVKIYDGTQCQRKYKAEVHFQ